MGRLEAISGSLGAARSYLHNGENDDHLGHDGGLGASGIGIVGAAGAGDQYARPLDERGAACCCVPCHGHFPPRMAVPVCVLKMVLHCAISCFASGG
jgi:hypothetical protein